MQLTNLMPAVSTLIPFEYTEIKSAVYDKIIAALLTEASTSRTPYLLQVGGIPGAGKSTFCSSCRRENSLFISFDKIMEMIPDYQADVYKLGRKESFHKWEIIARVIGYELLRQAVDKKLNIILEHSGVNEAHLQMMENLPKLGYDTEECFILCDIEKACKRAEEREKITNRHTPRELIEERAKLVEKYVHSYQKIVNHMSVYDSSNNKFELVKSYRKKIAG